MTPNIEPSFEDESYLKLLAPDKLALLWRQIEASEYGSYPDFTIWETLPLLKLLLPWNKPAAKAFLKVSVTRAADVMPEGRRKVVHPHGSVAKVAFVARGPNPYSGLFAGAAYGLLRLSLAVKPGVIVLPGVACKFLVGGQPSANFMAMHSLNGQMSYNFFAHPFSNILPQTVSPLLKPFADFFGLVSSTPTSVSLESLGRYDERGNPAALVRYPKRVVLSADPFYSFNAWPHDFRSDLDKIPAETPLFNVYAEDDATHYLLGSLVTKSRFIASAFGDDRLFFHHQRVDDLDVGPAASEPATLASTVH